MTGSLAYRKNEASILAGVVPAKYLRLLPHIHGERILEIGSAEGVLALLLANNGKDVTAVERNPERHASALALRDEWLRSGRLNANARTRHVCGDAIETINAVQPRLFDTLVAVRMIYYLRGELDYAFATIAEKIPNVVLCGNQNRASWWQQGIPDKPGGSLNYYASAAGMEDLLTRHGFEIVNVVTDGDPVVVGRK